MKKDNKELNVLQETLQKAISAILFKHDIMGINRQNNTSEYDPEAKTIIQKLHGAKEDDVPLIIYEDFVSWFSKDCVPLKEDAIYTLIAKEVWTAWKNNTGSA